MTVFSEPWLVENLHVLFYIFRFNVIWYTITVTIYFWPVVVAEWSSWEIKEDGADDGWGGSGAGETTRPGGRTTRGRTHR